MAAYRFGKRLRCNLITVDDEPERLAVAGDEAQENRIGSRG